jgi:hypothetical protein
MCKKAQVGLFQIILFTLLLTQLSHAGTYVIRPEDNSVYIDQRDPDSNFVSFTGILTASELNENARTVIHFNLGAWGPDSISQAKLYLYHYRGGNYTGSRTINVYPLTSGFDESTATWNSSWATPGGDYDNSINASAEVPEAWENWVIWDVTNLLKNRWSNIANYGFLIKDAVEGTPGDGPYVRFHSHRADSLPYLEVITAEQEIPTLTEWGLFIFGVALMGFVTWVFLKRRQVNLDFS